MREKDKANLKQLPKILESYQDELDLAEDRLRIKGKTLVQANQENASWQLYYDSRKVELHTLMKQWDTRKTSIASHYFKKYTETSNLDLSDRAKDKYINNEEEFLEYEEIYLMIKEIHDKYAATVDAFRSRGYALNNVTKLVCAQAEDRMFD
jgi:hypothetical protein